MAAGAGIFAAAVWTSTPLCPFALVTHLPCPGCGLTRATLALLRGDLRASFVFHPLAPILAPLVLVAVAFNAFEYIRRGRTAAVEAFDGRAWTAAIAVLGIALIAVWIARFFGAFGGPVAV